MPASVSESQSLPVTTDQSYGDSEPLTKKPADEPANDRTPALSPANKLIENNESSENVSGKFIDGDKPPVNLANEPGDGSSPPTNITKTPVAAINPHAPISAWAVCPPPPSRDYQPSSIGNREQADTSLSGMSAQRGGDGTLTLIGDARAERADQRLQAERIVYNELDGTIDASGKLRYDEPALGMTASDGEFWFREDRGTFNNTQFRFYDRHGRGEAIRTKILKPGVSEFQTAVYTTCADNSNAWIMRANKLTLDQNEGVGVARNARLSLKGIPILYSPYLSFPIDDRRKSGFLAPSFGASDNVGTDISTPLYLNLAPNYDAIITPRYMEQRGSQLKTDFRYLRGGTNRGRLNVEYMPEDKETEESRTRITYNDNSRFGDHLTTNIKYDRVSDTDYINDLGSSLKLSSVTHLKRAAEANYNTDWWTAGLSVDDFQTVDRSISDTNKPYRRLPRVTFAMAPPVQPLGLQSTLRTEFVQFDHNAKVTAARTDVRPSISLPLRNSALDVTPTAGIRYTSYQLDNQAAGVDNKQTRSTPIFSLDNVVYFERDLNLGASNFTQTLEPRLYYLYVKGENQEDLPRFDTSQPSFTYNQLFLENRFSGADRMGDANQVSAALTTRLLDPRTGAERVRASIGQIYYLANRNVTLINTAPEKDSQSDIAAEMVMSLSNVWEASSNLVWSPGDSQMERTDARLQYSPGFRKIANISYRYRRSSQQQIDASILWPLSASWHVLGRWYYDLDDSENLERLIGIEYDSCCWGIRLVGREFINSTGTGRRSNTDIDPEINRAIMLQFVLKGLAHFGSNIESLLESGILGYTTRPED